MISPPITGRTNGSVAQWLKTLRPITPQPNVWPEMPVQKDVLYVVTRSSSFATFAMTLAQSPGAG